MKRGDVNVDPIEAEFFTTEALDSLSDALVREAIQNSLDAGKPQTPVLFKISFCPPGQGLTGSIKERYLAGLQTHLVADNIGLTDSPAPDVPMDFILLEDFGTRGLCGDIDQDEDTKADESGGKNDFFYFWRNIGRAVEGATARGRWGLGKTVFQAASRINSFFGLTIRETDRSPLLMGQSVLKIHWSKGVKYVPYGYYGLFEDGFALPTDDPDFVNNFYRDFSLRRKKEPGLSVLVPFPEKEIEPRAVIQSVIVHYFFPILDRGLVVTINDGTKDHVLNARTIRNYVLKTDWESRDSILSRLELTAWGLGLPEEDYAEVNPPLPGQAPKWDEGLFASGLLERLRQRLDRGEKVALKIPLTVQETEGVPRPSFFKVFIKREENLERGEDHFIREGVTIAGVSSLRQSGVRVIVSVADRPLSKLLGDSENPAHTEWQERSPKFRGRYKLGASCLRFVKNSSREIVKILSRPVEGRDKTLLRHLFYLDIPPRTDSSGSMGAPGDDGPKPDQPDVIAQDIFLALKRIKGGFRLTRAPEAKKLPKLITIRMAYDVRRGNPFRKYQPLDFELDKAPIKVRAQGAKVSDLRLNILDIILKKSDFEIVVTGFDPNRDLKIKTGTSLDPAL